MAGTVGGTTFGVAKDVRLHAVRVLGRNGDGTIGTGCGGSGLNSEIIVGIDWVRANHVRPAVANMSFGGGTSNAVDDAVRALIAAGVTVVVAAGNDGVDASTQSPARVEQAITVGATDSSDSRALASPLGPIFTSNFGSVLDVVAPGVNITSAGITSNTATAVKQGTSMAAPHVAGVAALYLESNPQANPATTQLAIVMNATSKVINRGTGSPNRLLYSFVNTQLLTSDPAAVSWGPGRVDIFARGADNALWHMYYYDNRVWSTWESLGGNLTSGPAVSSWESGRLDVFARGTGGTLKHIYYYDNRVWGPWEDLGGDLAPGSGPGVSSWEPGRLDVFTRGTDNALKHIYYSDNRVWSGWESLGGQQLTSDPDAVSWGWGRVDVFARGTDNALKHIYYSDNRVWSGWESLGEELTSGPGVSSWESGRLDIFARGRNSGLLHKYYYDNRVWSGWELL